MTTREVLRAGPLEVRVDDDVAEIDGRALNLTRHEFSLLVTMVRRQGAVVSRESLADQAWGRPLAHGDRSVDVYVRRLRLKLAEAAPEWKFIHTHFAFGYRFGAVQSDPPPN